MIRQRVSKIIATDVQDKLKGLLVSKYYKELKRCLGLSSREVNELQNEKIKKLIHHAWKNVSYYDHLFESENINPDLIKSAEDLNRIPPLTREIIQEHFDELIDKNTSYKRVSKGSSSGSTGQAVSYMHDEFGVSSGKAAHFLGWELGGYQFGDKGLHIWGNPAIVKNVWSKPSSKIMSKLTRIDKFAAFQLTENGRFDQLVETINKNKYDFIDGYTNAIYLLANFIEKNNLKVHKLKYVLTTAENLHDYQREVIERVLGSVFDEYGCGEITGVAYQNKFQPGYAVIDPHVVVEYDKSFSDSSGSHPLIITNLDNMVMPLIRYKNGDMGIEDDHSFTKALPFSVMMSISGRQSDVVTLPNGGALSVPSFFGSVLLKEISSIRQYQVEKIAHDHIRINFVVNEALTDKDSKIIHDALDEYLGNSINYSIKVVDSIAVSKTGKFKLLIDRTVEK